MRVMVQPLSELLDGDSTAYFSVVKVCSAASVSLVDDGVTDFVCNTIIWQGYLRVMVQPLSR